MGGVVFDCLVGSGVLASGPSAGDGQNGIAGVNGVENCAGLGVESCGAGEGEYNSKEASTGLLGVHLGEPIMKSFFGVHLGVFIRSTSFLAVHLGVLISKRLSSSVFRWLSLCGVLMILSSGVEGPGDSSSSGATEVGFSVGQRCNGNAGRLCEDPCRAWRQA